MYRLNVCLLSGIFEKSFGLTNFEKDYTAVLGELNAAVKGANNFPYSEEEYLKILRHNIETLHILSCTSCAGSVSD